MHEETITIVAGNLPVGDKAFVTSRPVHRVQVAPFSMMIGTVTNAHFAQFASAGGYRDESLWTAMGWRWQNSKSNLVPAFWQDANFNHPQQPIVGISWYEALAYTRWKARITGQQWRLPTEVEWEVAAMGTGTGTIHSAEHGLQHTLKSIGEGYQQDNGLWNMRGNIWEWCSTRWGRNWQQLDYPYPYLPDDGREDLSGSFARVMRGGSWFDPIQESHTSKRARFLPGSRASNIGFRIVLDSNEP